MSIYRRRVETIRALVAGSVVARNAPMYGLIDQELQEVYNVVRVPQLHRRRLLQVLHTTRSLDSGLAEFVRYHQLPHPGRSLGQYLTALSRNNAHTLLAPLPGGARARYQVSIVNVRNRYMHEAGAFPATDGEIMTLLSEMDACLVQVLSL